MGESFTLANLFIDYNNNEDKSKRKSMVNPRSIHLFFRTNEWMDDLGMQMLKEFDLVLDFMRYKRFDLILHL